MRWNPDPTPFLIGPRISPEPWESGWKDTSGVGADSVLTLLVQWPSAEELGFDPDQIVPVSADAETAPGVDRNAVRGYVWHCHNLEHEDHDMMQRIRIQS